MRLTMTIAVGWLLAVVPVARADQQSVQVVREVSARDHHALYIANREPLAPSPLLKLPIGAITPKGWLRRQLELERDGITGHLPELSPFCRFEGNAWGDRQGRGLNSWESLPYWLKGYGDLGYVLKDEVIIRQTRRWIEAMLASQEPDGWFGPREFKTGEGGWADLWPHMLALNVLQSYYESSGDDRVLKCLSRYFRWQLNYPEDKFIISYWARMRRGDNLESVYWLYNRTGEAWLLDLAKKIHRCGADWAAGIPDWHGVNLAQGFREPGVYCVQPGQGKLLAAAERNYQTLMSTYGQFPGGGFAADEFCRPGYVDPRQGCETCSWVEFMHSFEMLTKISGNPLWADRCEEIAFNSLPASQTPDQKGIHYLTAANVVELDRRNKAPYIQDSGAMFQYSPGNEFGCCQRNVSQGWPYYAEELWLATADKGLCASLYAASEVTAKVGDGAVATVAEATDYPFGDTVELKLAMARSVRFPLYLRIPRWCRTPAIQVDGQDAAVAAEPLSFVRIEREWSPGDTVSLRLPMTIDVRRWTKNQNAVSVNYGPLWFSLAIGERWSRFGGTDKWPGWEVFPTTPWNYGFVLDEKAAANSFELNRGAGPLPRQPFTLEAAPIQLKAKARRISHWTLNSRNLIGALQPSPVRSDEPIETITLIPMGAARLRVTAFPTIGNGPEAHDWVETDFRASASCCLEPDSTDALSNGNDPSSSNPRNVPRFSWSNHKGTAEWVQYDFVPPRTISAVEVYWFDDGAKGVCRTPASWRLLYKDGEAWKPVEDVSCYGVKIDAFNRTEFRAVQTRGLRIEVQLQPKCSGGILQWKLAK